MSVEDNRGFGPEYFEREVSTATLIRSIKVPDVEQRLGIISIWEKQVADSLNPLFLPLAKIGLHAAANAIVDEAGLINLASLQGIKPEGIDRPGQRTLHPKLPFLVPGEVGINPDVRNLVSSETASGDEIPYQLMDIGNEVIAAAQAATWIKRAGRVSQNKNTLTASLNLVHDPDNPDKCRKALNSQQFPTSVSIQFSPVALAFFAAYKDSGNGITAITHSYTTVEFSSNYKHSAAIYGGFIKGNEVVRFIQPTQVYSRLSNFAKLAKVATNPV